jgi:DNA helicase II / ATP-dependent DNA helicase PcrA
LRPSRFVNELLLLPTHKRERPGATHDSPVAGALRGWRRQRARQAGVPAYVVFNDRTLDEIARRLPRTSSELASVPGMGPLRMRGYGDEILAVVNRFADALS